MSQEKFWMEETFKVWSGIKDPWEIRRTKKDLGSWEKAYKHLLTTLSKETEIAICLKKPETLKRLLGLGLNVNKKDKVYGNPANPCLYPLVLAVRNIFPQMVKILLEADADPNVFDRTGKSPLNIAVEYDDKPIVKMLLEAKANPNVRDFKYFISPLWWATYIESTDIVQLLLDAKADVHLPSIHCESPLDKAKNDQNKEILSLMQKSLESTSFT